MGFALRTSMWINSFVGPGRHDTTIGERILGAEDNGEHEEPQPPCAHATRLPPTLTVIISLNE